MWFFAATERNAREAQSARRPPDRRATRSMAVRRRRPDDRSARSTPRIVVAWGFAATTTLRRLGHARRPPQRSLRPNTSGAAGSNRPVTSPFNSKI
jgi:hypothetical protein